MNSTPRVETVEISDADLDTVSGGQTINTLNAAANALDSVAPVSSLVSSGVSTTEDVTGLNTAPVTDLVAAL